MPFLITCLCRLEPGEELQGLCLLQRDCSVHRPACSIQRSTRCSEPTLCSTRRDGSWQHRCERWRGAVLSRSGCCGRPAAAAAACSGTVPSAVTRCRALALGDGLCKLPSLPCPPSSVGLWQLLPLLDERMIHFDLQPTGPGAERSPAG